MATDARQLRADWLRHLRGCATCRDGAHAIPPRRCDVGGPLWDETEAALLALPSPASAPPELRVPDLVGEDLGKCPFCGSSIGASGEPPAVMHAMPLCDRFIVLDADAFLQAVREARGLPPP